MLVLTRKKNEVIRIGNNVTITIVDIRENKVRVGIAAPKEVPVHREEVYQARNAELVKKRERQETADFTNPPIVLKDRKDNA